MSTTITIISIIMTVSIYCFSRIIGVKYPSPLTTPVFFCTVIIILLLYTSGVSYEQYEPAKDLMTYLLGPATVALAIPIYKHRKLLLSYCFPVAISLIAGSLVTILTGFILAKLFHLTDSIVASLTVKSATVPIAVEVTKIIHGDPSLAAVFVVSTGIVGAMFGPYLLDKLRIVDPLSRGLSMGTIAHGIGTAEISREGQLQGAISGVAMVIAAIFISFIVPIFYWLLG